MSELIKRNWKGGVAFLVAALLQLSGITSTTLAAFVALVAAIWTLYANWHQLSQWKITSPIVRKAADDELKAESDGGEPTFNARLQLIDKVMLVNLLGLWQDDVSPWIEITVYIRNASPFPVIITRVTGHLLCAGAECQYPARLENAPVRLGPITDYHELKIRQPITTEMQQAFTFQPHKLNLFAEDTRVLFQLSAIQLEGTVDLPTGTVPLPNRAVSADNFYVRGPVRNETDDKMLWPFEPTFVSQSHYVLDGQRREEKEPVQVPEPPDEQLVLLCNSYAIPAFDALHPVLKAIYDECFSRGGSHGLSARYFRDYAFQPQYGEALRNMQECIAGGKNRELESAFTRYCGTYLFAGAFVWHNSKIGVLADVKAISEWVKRHDALIEQVRILSGGIGRKGLETFLALNDEYIPMPREVFTKAST